MVRDPGDVGADGVPQSLPHGPHDPGVRRRVRGGVVVRVDGVADDQHPSREQESGERGDQAGAFGKVHEDEPGVDQVESAAGIEVRGGDVRFHDVEPGEGVGGQETHVSVDGEDGVDVLLPQQPPADRSRSGAQVEAVPSRSGAEVAQAGHRDVVVGERAEVDAVALADQIGWEDVLAVPAGGARPGCRPVGPWVCAHVQVTAVSTGFGVGPARAAGGPGGSRSMRLFRSAGEAALRKGGGAVRGGSRRR